MAYYSPLFPDPVTYTVNITKQFKDEMVNRFPPSGGFMPWLKETLELYHSLFYFGLSEIAHILLIAGGLTLLRVILNRFVFKPLPLYFKVIEYDAVKFTESAWKTLIYTITWFWAFYLCIFTDEQYFFQLDNVWSTFEPGREVPTSIYWLYMVQIGFYVHCVYASIFIETIRKDFAVLMLHHFVTLCLLTFSYGSRLVLNRLYSLKIILHITMAP
jgi:hypothetical protein